MSQPTRIVFDAEIREDGRFLPAAATVTRARLAKWAGKHVTVVVTRYVKPKTGSQLGYYFGVIVVYMAEHVGQSEKEMDRDFRDAFLPYELHVNKITGVEEPRQIELRDATAEQMSEFIDACIRECANQGCRIPSPEEFFKGITV